MTNKILSIVIPVYNKWNYTKACLKDLSYLPDNHEIIIIDNASTDETNSGLMEMMNSPELCWKVLYKRNDTNLGFAKACNIGFSAASAPNILFLNNDIRVKSNYSNWTQVLIDRCHQGLVGPTMGQLDDNFNFIKEANGILSGNSYMGGWCLASSRENWSKLHIPRTGTFTGFPPPQIFSEEFGLAYFEDTDLSFRARQLGIPFKIIDVPVIHFGKQTSKQLNIAKLYQEAKSIFVKKWSK